MRWLTSGRRGTLIDYLCLWGCFAVLCVVLHQGLTRKWREEGLPAAANSYLRWEKQHTPRWFVNFFLPRG